ncbi:MAG TPA: hypothetical protein VGG76_05435 [Gemmatimonadaceae bacterium]
MNKAITILVAAFGVASPVGAQSLPPVRQLGPVTAVAKEQTGAISAIRPLADGRVIVNDIVGRRVLMFDSTLANATVIADTTSATANAYGVQPGGLIAFRGDSTLFVDVGSLSMLLIDPFGKVARVMSAPRPQDVRFLIGGPFGNPGFDPQGRLVYRAPPNFAAFGPPPGAGGSNGRLPQFPTLPDSAAIVRYDLATRKVDTITYFKTPKVNLNVTQTSDGGIRVINSFNPLPQGDDWALLPDGTIALVRTKDYHVDWLGQDGKIISSPRIPFNWQRLTDEQKVAFVDSAKIAIEKQRASGTLFGGGTQQLVIGGDAGGAVRRPGGGDRAPGATVTTTTSAPAPSQLPPLTMVPPTDLPDYKPAFSPGSTRVDADGNLWIRTSENVDSRPVYDVVSRQGTLIDRVQLPANRTLVGFGAGGVAYLAVRDGATAHLEKARVK